MKKEHIPNLFEIRSAKLKELADGYETQKKFAEKAGLDPTVVSRMLYPVDKPNRRNIGEKAAREIEAALNLPIGWLDNQDPKEPSNVSYAGPYIPGKKYPVLSSVQAGAWSEAIEAYTLDEISEWLESDAHIQGNAFWLKVEGESMTAPAGISVPEGSFVLFDTGRDPVNGSLVIAKLVDDNEATFKKLIIDTGKKYLKALNPAWPPMIPINGNCKIIGVGVETKMRLI
ncbi:LexA family protein [Rosenbergiella nectarea]|uniref:LexA family protein n=1 Tax=Rosenbergiella nectarea TaxID=988801 RepID=UPI001F4E091B|nr:XRE family transcriptional regulator [Rosenbergiella nectarea]